MSVVTLVNCFEVPVGREDEFFTLWKEVNAYMQAKPGYLGHTLHKSLAPNAAFRFVNVARWRSKADFDAVVKSVRRQPIEMTRSASRAIVLAAELPLTPIAPRHIG